MRFSLSIDVLTAGFAARRGYRVKNRELMSKCGSISDGVEMAKMSDADYFASDEFKRRADARAMESFEVTSLSESKRIYENYLKNQKAAKKGK